MMLVGALGGEVPVHEVEVAGEVEGAAVGDAQVAVGHDLRVDPHAGDARSSLAAAGPAARPAARRPRTSTPGRERGSARTMQAAALRPPPRVRQCALPGRCDDRWPSHATRLLRSRRAARSRCRAGRREIRREGSWLARHGRSQLIRTRRPWRYTHEPSRALRARSPASSVPSSARGGDRAVPPAGGGGEHDSAALAGQTRLHPPLHRRSLARATATAAWGSSCATTTTSSATPTTAGARTESATSTDIGHWWTWFRGPSASAYLAALYAESDQHSGYSRLATDPGGAERDRACSRAASPTPSWAPRTRPSRRSPTTPSRDSPYGGGDFTVANAKGIYRDLLPILRRAHRQAVRRRRRAAGHVSRHARRAGTRRLARRPLAPGLGLHGRQRAGVRLLHRAEQQRRRRHERCRERARQPPPHLEQRRPAQDGRRRRPPRLPQRRREVTPTPPATRRPLPSSSRCSTPPTTRGRATAAAIPRVPGPTRRAGPS